MRPGFAYDDVRFGQSELVRTPRAVPGQAHDGGVIVKVVAPVMGDELVDERAHHTGGMFVDVPFQDLKQPLMRE
jgi:hypothetical protein